MSKLKLNEDDINKIIELYKNGLKQSEIAKLFNVSDTHVSRILKQNGIKKSNTVISEFQEKDILSFYLKTNNITKTAKEYSISPTDIIILLQNNNIVPATTSDAHRKFSLNEHYFNKIDTPNKAYILGFFYADGNVGSTDYSVTIGLQECDKYILEHMNKEFENNKPLGYKQKSFKHRIVQPQYRIQIYSKIMHSDLIDKGVVPNKSLIIKYPTFLPDELQSHFVRGVFDGDGCVTCYKAKYSYRISVSIVGTYDFCTVLKEICERLLHIHPRVYQTCANGITSSMYINRKDEIAIFMEWLYGDADMFLTRKYNKYHDFFNTSNKVIA